jgi:hypothetical protein
VSGNDSRYESMIDGTTVGARPGARDELDMGVA